MYQDSKDIDNRIAYFLRRKAMQYPDIFRETENRAVFAAPHR